MKLTDIDYCAIYGNTWLHKISARYKLLSALLILIIVLAVKDYKITGIIYSILFSIIIFSNLPKLKILALSLYPLIFASFFLLSSENISIIFLLLLIFKVTIPATVFVLLVFTTPFYEIFKSIEKYLPSFLVSVLFITYRSIFILWRTLENLQLAMYIRGKLNIKKPLYSIKTLANALGFLVISAIEASENMYQGMRIRGFSGNMRYLRK